MHTRFDEIFRISVGLKGLDALTEILGGALLLIIKPASLLHFVSWLTTSDLRANPHDFIANLIVHSAHGISVGSTLFGAIYLLSHGLIKIFVVVAVLLNKFWAYPTMIIVLMGFVIYQLLHLLSKFSWAFTLLTVFDVFVIVMTTLEWRKQIELHELEAANQSGSN